MIISGVGAQGAEASSPLFEGVLRRQKYVLGGGVALGLLLAAIGYVNMPWGYTSQAILILDSRRLQGLPAESVVTPLPQDSPVLRTELDLINSRTMAGKVIDSLENRGIAIHIEEPGVTWLSKWLGLPDEAAVFGIEQKETEPPSRRTKVDHLLSDLSVTNDGRSYSIYISYNSRDPDYAAEVANAFAQAYLHYQTDVQRNATQKVTDWLGSKLANLKKQLQAAERAEENFRQENGLGNITGPGPSLQEQRVTALNTQLVAADATLASAQARLQTAQELVKKEDVPALAEVLGSTAIQALRTKQADVERQLNDLQDSGATMSNQIPLLKAQNADLKKQISDEIGRIVQSLQTEAQVAQSKRDRVKTELDAQQKRLAELNSASIGLSQLEREVAADRTVYQSYLTRYKQTIEQEGIAEPDVQIVSSAEPSLYRENPRLLNWILLGFGIGGTLGIGGASIREWWSGPPLNPIRLETAIGVPIINYLPRLSHRARRTITARGDPDLSVFAAMFDAVQRRVGAGIRGGAKVLALTSPSSGDGKTTIALGLARFAAATGRAVALVEADLTTPSLAQSLKIGKVKGREEAAKQAGDDVGAMLEALLVKDQGSDVWLLPARIGRATSKATVTPGHLLGLVAALSARFDLVIVDTPDLRRRSEAAAGLSSADAILLVVRGDTANTGNVIAAIHGLGALDQTAEGIILNRADRLQIRALSAETKTPPRKRRSWSGPVKATIVAEKPEKVESNG
jgi:uncharacterized protein involved in exopolysaccharide biosynthesis/MinD-like ATPase involved in chromosome partitioning or flagellar assembly